MSQIRSRLAPLVVALAMAAVPAACGGSSSYHLPVDSQMKPFAKPDADDLVSSDDDSDYEDMGDDSAAGTGDTDSDTDTGTKTPAPTPTPAPASGAAPAGGNKTPAPGGKQTKPAKSAKAARATTARHATAAPSK